MDGNKDIVVPLQGQPGSSATASFIAGSLRMLTGVVPCFAAALPEGSQFIFYCNHSSHLDAVVLWSLLPTSIRYRTRPVAAQDYWLKGRVRKFLACRVFNVILVTRRKEHANSSKPSSQHAVHQSLADMTAALADGCSLILFPEGTRGTGDMIAPFKSGLYHLARLNPSALLVPVYLENLNRILPKGELLIVPLICNAHFGTPFQLDYEESKSSFLERARQAMEELRN